MLKLKVIYGDRKGEEFTLKDGFRIGRAAGDLVLADGKVSNLHAFVKSTPSGELILYDNQSKNGLRVKGKKVSQVVLAPQSTFQIGDSAFEVFDADHLPPEVPNQNKLDVPPPHPEALDDEPTPPLAGAQKAPEKIIEATKTMAKPQGALPKRGEAPAPLPEPEPIEPEPLTWSEVITEYLKDSVALIKNTPAEIKPFSPAVRLYFSRGVQVETSWLIGYGPRWLGTLSVDLQILEPGAPEICFELHPSDQGVLFKTAHPETVLVNGISQKSKHLRAGDIIRVKETELEVSFEK